MIERVIAVGIGGAIGSILRYLASLWIANKYQVGNFPLATFLINISGCILIGLFIGLFERGQLINSDIKLLLITGVCGGYTTFSTFSLENIQLINNGNYLTACIYAIASVLLGIGAVWLGGSIAKLF